MASKKNESIDQLLQAERDAMKLRSQRMRQAHEEAASAVAAFKKEREQELKNLKESVVAGRGKYEQEMSVSGQQQIADLNQQCEQNKGAVIDLLLATVTHVEL